jgi:TolA-binding protein
VTRPRFKWRAAIAVCAMLAIAGCATTTDMSQVNQNQFVLRGMIAADRQKIDALENQIRLLNDQIAVMKHGTEEGASDQNSPNARLAKLEADVAALQATNVANASAPPPATVPEATGEEAPPPPADSTAPPPAPAAVPELQATWPQDLDQEIEAAKSSHADGIKIYRQGLDAMKEGKYAIAVGLFARLQHSYPKSEVTEPAEYFAANALYEVGKYDQAVLQFNDLVMRSPKGKYAGQALLREAQAFLKLNDRIDARLTLQKLEADHSGTPEAAAGDTMLKDLVND